MTPGDPIEIYPTSVEDGRQPNPTSFTLSQNYPNPFNGSTIIEYYVPENKTRHADVQLQVYDLLGRQVRDLINEDQQTGEHSITWNGTDDTGKGLPSGVYFYGLHIPTAGVAEYKKMVLMK